MSGQSVSIKAILKRPYHFAVVREEGSYFAEVLEFPGCFATGLTSAEALTNLESVVVDWLRATIAMKQTIPEPIEGGRTIRRALGLSETSS